MEQIGVDDSFILVGYSYGGLIAMELAVILEQEGKIGKVILIESCLKFKKLMTITSNGDKDEDIRKASLSIIINSLNKFVDRDAVLVINKRIAKLLPTKCN